MSLAHKSFLLECFLFLRNYRLKSFPVSILRKSISGRHRPVRVADGPMTARCRFTSNASWVIRKIERLNAKQRRSRYEPSHLDLCCLQKRVIIACGSERGNVKKVRLKGIAYQLSAYLHVNGYLLRIPTIQLHHALF